MTGFRDHLKNLATFDLNMNIDNKYHDMVEDEIQIINDIVAHERIEETNDEEIAKAIRSINRGQSADYRGLTIEHIEFLL
jgi:ribosomal protein S13